MVASVFPPVGHPTWFIEVDFLSFMGCLCGTRGEVMFRSARCSLGSKAPSGPGTPIPSGVQVSVGYVHFISGVGHHFSLFVEYDTKLP